MPAIQHRHEFLFILIAPMVIQTATRMPAMRRASIPRICMAWFRMSPWKRRIRNYVHIAHEPAPHAIFVEQATNLNRKIAVAHEKAGGVVPEKGKTTKSQVSAARKWMCETFYDVRTFGAVMSTGPNAGQVRGPVQIAFARSVDPVLPSDVALTRMAIAEDPKGVKSSADYQVWEDAQPEEKMRTMDARRLSLMAFSLREVSSARTWPRTPASDKPT